MTVKQEDRDAAKSIQWVVTTIDDHEAIAKAFALVREAAEQAAAERERVLVQEIRDLTAERDALKEELEATRDAAEDAGYFELRALAKVEARDD